jgi:hypothetical protein
MLFILLHVQFVDELFISVLKNWATFDKNWQHEIEKSKKSPARPLYFTHTRLFHVPKVRYWVHVRVSKEHIQKSKIMEMVPVIGFIDWARLWLS